MRDSTKKILIIDDSALMRRIICDIISLDEEFEVADMAADGAQGIAYLSKNTYDVVILDVVMPKVDGISVLKKLQNKKDAPPVIMFSNEVGDGSAVTILALELGAFDFIRKPGSIMDAKDEMFVKNFLQTLRLAAESKKKPAGPKTSVKSKAVTPKKAPISIGTMENSIVAIACSTGGPKTLQRVLPKLPETLDVPVLIVQHMPAGFTASLAQRLDEMCKLNVVEAQDGQKVENGTVYLAKGGMHMEVVKARGGHKIRLVDGPTREGVKPCANYMYESLGESGYASVVCVVLTGMGQDGTKGIQNLKSKKTIYTIAQDEMTSVVYGMPRAVYQAGLADQVEPIDNVAEAISKVLGVE